jgi:hypothetical protein
MRAETYRKKLTVVLWAAAVYVALLYVALRWGGHGPPENLLPSAD